jgi:hypothetical protein
VGVLGDILLSLPDDEDEEEEVEEAYDERRKRGLFGGVLTWM